MITAHNTLQVPLVATTGPLATKVDVSASTPTGRASTPGSDAWSANAGAGAATAIVAFKNVGSKALKI